MKAHEKFFNGKSNLFKIKLTAIIVFSFICAVIIYALCNDKSNNYSNSNQIEKIKLEAYDPGDTNMALFTYSASTSYIKANDEVAIKLQGVENKLYKSTLLTADKIRKKAY